MQSYARIWFIMFWLVNSSLTIRQLWINELLYTKEKTVNRFVCSCVDLKNEVLETYEVKQISHLLFALHVYNVSKFINSISLNWFEFTGYNSKLIQNNFSKFLRKVDFFIRNERHVLVLFNQPNFQKRSNFLLSWAYKLTAMMVVQNKKR